MSKATTAAVTAFAAIAGAFTATATIYATSDSYSLIGDLRGQESVMLDGVTADQCLNTLRTIRPHWGTDVTLSCAIRP